MEESKVKLMALNDTKAGMDGLDTDKINQIMEEASKGSKFYQHKKEVQEKLDQRVQQMKKDALRFNSAQILRSEREMDVRAKEIENRRDLSRTIVHLDMDAFFAAVEMRDNPALRNVPMAVGSSSMLSTSNYLARRFGVRAAMPGFIAKKLCPQLIIVPVDFDKYQKASAEVYEILAEYDPQTSMSLDEAQMDLTDYLNRENCVRSENKFATAEEIVQEIRHKIFAKTDLTASAGIAPNGFLAKICSNINKPNNQFYLDPTIESVKSFVENLSIRKVNGIGAVTEQMLNGMEIRTCGDIWKKRGLINLLFKPSTISFLLNVATGNGHGFMSREQSGEDDSTEDRKSLSCERTFEATSNTTELKEMCQELCSHVKHDLVRKGLLCKAVCLKIKTASFHVKTRVRSLADFTCDADIIFSTAWKIFQSFQKEFPKDYLNLRLMGVRASNFKSLQGLDENSTNSSELSGFNKQTRIDVLMNKASSKNSLANRDTQCPNCLKMVSLLEVENHEIKCTGAVEQNSLEVTKESARLSAELYEEKELATTAEVLLDLFPVGPSFEIECPICLDKIANSNELENLKQLALQVHYERCILDALQECDISMNINNVISPVKLVEHSLGLRKRKLDSAREDEKKQKT